MNPDTHLMGKSRAAAILGTALLYVVTGRLGLLLAIPPGYATAIWPPSAVAAASVVYFGPHAAIGAWLGSFAVNLWVGLDPSSTAGLLKSSAIAGLIAIGAVLQAIASRALSRRYVQFKSPFESGRDVLLFLLWSGPVSCLVNATWSVTALTWMGSITSQDYFYSWGTWWVGDTIGVITLAPVFLILLCRSDELNLRRKFAVTLPLAATFTLAIAIFVLASRLEQRRITLAFEIKAARISNAIHREMTSYSESLQMIREAHSLLPKMDAAAFRKLSEFPLKRHPGMIALAWIPRVTANDRIRFEKELRDSGNPGFTISERSREGDPTPAPAKPEYYPVTFVEPRGRFASVAGFDLASDPARYESLLAGRRSGLFQVSARITLLNENQDNAGVMLSIPVFKNDVGRTLLGFFATGVRIDDLLRSAISGEDVSSLDFQILDASYPGEVRSLANFPKPATADRGPPAWESAMEIGGRTWKVRFSQNAEFRRANRGWQAWLTLVAGLCFSALLGGFLLVLTGRTSQVERQVALRTSELAERTSQLTDQQQTFALSSKMIALGEMAGGVAHEINNPLQIIHGYAEILSRGLQESEPDLSKLNAVAQKILVTVSRIAKIVRGLKSFARDGDPEPHDFAEVSDIVAETLELCGEKFRNHGITLPDPMIPRGLGVHCNRQQISQILLNLLNNAFFVAKDCPNKEIRLDVRSVGAEVEISVMDGGPGIPSQLADRLFQPFFTTKPVGAGTGLGLSVSKGLAEKNGGRLRLDRSSPQTRFVLTLPIALEATA